MITSEWRLCCCPRLPAAGLYYAPGSLKAQLCVDGRRQLYAFCQQHNIPYRRLGKLLVATSDAQLAALEALRARAAANGVADLRLLSGPEAAQLEPAVSCRAALLSPSTGIVDSHRRVLDICAFFLCCWASLGGDCRHLCLPASTSHALPCPALHYPSNVSCPAAA